VLSQATGSVSSGNLSAFDIIGSKVHEIAGDDIVTIGNKESCRWQYRNFKSKTSSPKFCCALLN